MEKYKHKISVVLSVWNRAHQLIWTLPTILDQDPPPDEVVIVDDGSTDKTRAVVKKFQHNYPNIDIKYYYNFNPGYTTETVAMNIGIRKATKDIVMITLGDLLHVTNDVGIALEHFDNPENENDLFYAGHIYFVHFEIYRGLLQTSYLLPKAKGKGFLDNPVKITKLPCVHDIVEEGPDYVAEQDTITYFSSGPTHYIAAMFRKHLIAVKGYDEDWAWKYRICGGEDQDLFSRLHAYGLKYVPTKEMTPIHLPHKGAPEEWLTKEKQDMATKLLQMPPTRKVNIGRKWGKLKEIK